MGGGGGRRNFSEVGIFRGEAGVIFRKVLAATIFLEVAVEAGFLAGVASFQAGVVVSREMAVFRVEGRRQFHGWRQFCERGK